MKNGNRGLVNGRSVLRLGLLALLQSVPAVWADSWTNGSTSDALVTSGTATKVGIGVATPIGILDIRPAAATSGVGLPLILQAQAGGSSSAGGNLLLNSGPNGVSGSNGSILFGTGGTVSSDGTYASGEKMRIDPSGKVGIGTITPVGLLHVSNLAAAYNEDHTIARFGNRTSTGRTVELSVDYRGQTMGDGWLVLREDRSNSDFMDINLLSQNNKIIFPNGNIGIGQTNPSAKLDVNGNAKINGTLNVTGDASFTSSSFMNTGNFFVPSTYGYWIGPSGQYNYGIYESNGNLNLRSAGSLFMNSDGATTSFYKPVNVNSDMNVSGNKLIVGNTTGSNSIVVMGNAGTPRDIQINSNTSAFSGNRWVIRGSSDAENPGTNTGTSLQIIARGDDGNTVDIPIQIPRAAGGMMSISRPITLSGQGEGITLNRDVGSGYVRWENGSGINTWLIQRNPATSGSLMGSLVLWSSVNSASNGVFNISPSLSGAPVFSVDIPNKTVSTGGRVTINDEGLVLNRTIGNGYISWQNGSGIDAWALQRHEANGSLVLWTAGPAANGQFKIANALSGNPVFMVDVPNALTTVSGNLTASGKIGVGMTPTSISSALSVKASQPWETQYDNTLELLGASTLANNPTIHFKPVSNGPSTWISSPMGGGMQFGVNEDENQNAQTGVTPLVLTAGGNVALATNAGGQVIVGSIYPNMTPGIKMDVEGDARVSGALIARTFSASEGGSWGNMAVGNTDGIPGFYLGYKWTNAEVSGPALSQTNDGTTTVNGVGASAVKLSVDGTTKVTVDPALVTVATNMTVNGDLSVGTVKARNWEVTEAPDYVFEKDYPLASLEKVESFVKKNQHLPEVPSAKQMKAEGLDLVKMNFHLLKKVEELTLYTIQQNKELAALKERLERIERSPKVSSK